MEHPQGTVARKRIVTSCSNCYRRKQRCNRRKPCNNCTVRKVGHECFYDTSPWDQLSRPTHETKSETSRDKKPDGYLEERSSNFEDLFGYSSIDGSNAFVESSEILQNLSRPRPEISRTGSTPTTSQKYWHLVSQLPDVMILDELITLYISDIHWIYGIIEPYYLKQNLIAWREFTSNASGAVSIGDVSAELKCVPALLFQLIATTLSYVPRGTKNDDSLELSLLTSQKYSELGVELVQVLGYQGLGLNAVLHDLLRAAWLKNNGSGVEAWHALSISIRKAQDLNLHRRSRGYPSSSKADFWYNEWNKRIWMNLHMWDSNMSILLGRPRLINAVDCDAEPPIDFDIPEDLESLNLSTIQQFNVELRGPPSSVSMCIILHSIAQIINEVRTLGADKRELKDYTVVQRLHFQLLSFLESVSPAFRFPNPDTSWDWQKPFLPLQREKIYTSIHSLLVALHRPHVAKHVESRHRAQQAALNVLESQQRLFELMSRNHYAYFGNAFFSIDATIVLCTIASVYLCNNIEDLGRIVLAIQLAIGRLSLIEVQNKLAPFGIGIVRTCYHTVKDKYDKIKLTNFTFAPAWLSSTELGGLQNLIESDQNHSFPEQKEYADLDFPSFDNGVVNETELTNTEGLGRNDFDALYWMEYTQQVLDDATSTFNGDFNLK